MVCVGWGGGKVLSSNIVKICTEMDMRMVAQGKGHYILVTVCFDN